MSWDPVSKMLGPAKKHNKRFLRLGCPQKMPSVVEMYEMADLLSWNGKELCFLSGLRKTLGVGVVVSGSGGVSLEADRLTPDIFHCHAWKRGY